MNLKPAIKRIICRMFPELGSKTHLPVLAEVTSIPDPPVGGTICTAERPFYAVNARLLKPDGSIDEAMPALRDIPVALPAGAPDRGFAALPQPGTIVEIAFAFGMQSKPFVRSVLPHNLKMPQIDDQAQRWQQGAGSFQEVDRNGNWTRQNTETISDISNEKISKATFTWLGSETENSLIILSQMMQSLIEAFLILATHTHVTVKPDQEDAIKAKQAEIISQKERLDSITKTPQPGE